jgi:hypothetical protein
VTISTSSRPRGTPPERRAISGTTARTDFIWIEDGEWKAVVLDPRLRDSYLASLALVRELDFDVLVPWGVTERDQPVGRVRDAAERRERVQAIIDRVIVGSDR